MGQPPEPTSNYIALQFSVEQFVITRVIYTSCVIYPADVICLSGVIYCRS